jgi:hypothetical protein
VSCAASVTGAPRSFRSAASRRPTCRLTQVQAPNLTSFVWVFCAPLNGAPANLRRDKGALVAPVSGDESARACGR